MKTTLPLLVIATLFVSCAHQNTSRTFKIKSSEIFTLNNPPSVGKTYSNQNVPIGGFSGLMFVKKENEEFIFKTITDRGPNGWQIDLDRPFLVPDFSPEIVTIKTNTNSKTINVTEELKLKKRNGTPASGLPNHRREENPIDVYGHMYSVDADGLDTEALVSDGEDGYWVVEEYGPTLVHLTSDGKINKRLFPGYELPKIYSERKTNRGFEGMARIENKIYGILQSPIPNDGNFNRIAEFDLETYKTSAEYFYKLDEQSDRVGDMIALPDNSLLVIEQNGKSGEKSYKKIYRISLTKSDEILTKELVVDLDQTEFKNHEKVEGLTFIDSTHLALVNDNDFTITGKTDFKTGLTPLEDIKTQLLILKLDNELY